MRAQLLNDQVIKTYIVIFDVDDPAEVIAGLTAFARRYSITAAQVTAIGGFRQTTVGYLDRDQKQYLPIVIEGNVEVISLIGDFSFDQEKNEPRLHLHAVVGLRDGSTRGGHLLSAHVGPTLEAIVNVSPATLSRIPNQDVGITLINLDDSAESIPLASTYSSLVAIKG